MTPPTGSTIRVEDEWGTPKLVFPHRKSPFQFLVAAFMCVWLCGWAIGLVLVSYQLLYGKDGPKEFLAVWLAGWSLGGVMAIYMLWKVLSAGVPETLSLSKPNLQYDSGTMPFTFSFDMRTQMEFMRRLLAKRKQLTLEPAHLATLKLREFDSGNRITIDYGADRIDLGVSLTEIEREWLYKALTDYYQLPVAAKS